jgi:sugar (pentulose or hexulose) kinase
MEYLIGLDIGTQGAKSLLIDRGSKQVGSSYSGYDVLQPKPLWAMHCLPGLRRALSSVLRPYCDGSSFRNLSYQGWQQPPL